MKLYDLYTFLLVYFLSSPLYMKAPGEKESCLVWLPSYLWSLPGTKQPSINTCEELREERGPQWPLQSRLGSYIIISVLPTKAGQAWLCTSSVSPTHGGLSVFARNSQSSAKIWYCERTLSVTGIPRRLWKREVVASFPRWMKGGHEPFCSSTKEPIK